MPAQVLFSASAQADLERIFERIADRAGLTIALGYTERIRRYRLGFQPFLHAGRNETICASDFARSALSAGSPSHSLFRTTQS